MKTDVKKATKDQSGKILILVLVLLGLGALLLAPLLGLMGTGLIAGGVYERKAAELYAADAGVEDAIWKIYNPSVAGLPHSPCRDMPWSRNYTISDVNSKGVAFTIDYLGDEIYRITSIAVGDDVSSTTVETYVELLVFDLFAGALVSSGDITFHKDCAVTGNVYYVGEIEGKDYTHDGEEIQVPLDAFPSQEQNEAFFRQFKDEALEGGTHLENNGNMKIDGSQTLGSIYIPGDLDITKEATITLDGVVYVKGSIRAENTLTVTGAGSIIAEGDIYFKKLADYTVTGDSVIMSLYGDITLKKSDPDGELSIEAFIYAPNGTITFDKDMTVVGSVVGAGIEIDKDGFFAYVAKASSFGFPVLVAYGAEIKTYTIT